MTHSGGALTGVVCCRHQAVVFGTSFSSNTARAYNDLRVAGIDPILVECDKLDNSDEFQDALMYGARCLSFSFWDSVSILLALTWRLAPFSFSRKKTEESKMPNIFVQGRLVPDSYTGLQAMIQDGSLAAGAAHAPQLQETCFMADSNQGFQESQVNLLPKGLPGQTSLPTVNKGKTYRGADADRARHTVGFVGREREHGMRVLKHGQGLNFGQPR